MKTLEISNEETPGDMRQRGNFEMHNSTSRCGTSHVYAETRRSGDVEIWRRRHGAADQLLTVIPKSKRAALAQFLVEAE